MTPNGDSFIVRLVAASDEARDCMRRAHRSPMSEFILKGAIAILGKFAAQEGIERR
jgi:hypothetical protein